MRLGYFCRISMFLFIAVGFVCNYDANGQDTSGKPQNKQSVFGELRSTFTPAVTESLGNKYLGMTRFVDSRLILSNNRGERFLDLNFNYNVNPDAAKILLPDKSNIAGGVMLPLPKNLKFRQVFNRIWVDSNEPYASDFTAFGSYLSGSSGKLDWKAGYEQDSKKTRLGYGIGEFRLNKKVLALSGVSFTAKEARYGTGFSITIPKHNYQVMFGYADALDTDKRATYIAGIGKCTDNKTRGRDPNYIFLYRNRPESQYVLGIFTLAGKSLQCQVNENIFSAFLEGGLGPVRIVNNRNFDTLGVGGSYRTQGYGKLALSVSLGRVHITSAVNSRFAHAELFYTFGKEAKLQLGWYTGLKYSGGDDIFFNITSAKPSLTNRYTDSLAISLGKGLSLFGKSARLELNPQVNLRTQIPSGRLEFSVYF